MRDRSRWMNGQLGARAASIIAAAIVGIALAPSIAHAESIEMICNTTHVGSGRTPIDMYYIIDTNAATVSDRSRNIGTYPARVTATTVDWAEGIESYFLDLNSGHLTFKPGSGYNSVVSNWDCRRAQKRF
jgi:hypothetical protein